MTTNHELAGSIPGTFLILNVNQVWNRVHPASRGQLRRKVNWIGHILRINRLLYDAIEGQMTEVKAIGRRTTTQHLDDLRNKK